MSNQEIITSPARLQELEQIIEKNIGAFYTVGMALREIRDNFLYKEYGYIRFQDYCKERWDIGRRQGYRLLASTEVVENLKDSVNGTIVRPTGSQGIQLPTNERQVRPLINLEPEQQCKVWYKVIEAAPKTKAGTLRITGKLVEDVAVKVIGNGHLKSNVDIIKPTNWWGIGQPYYPKQPGFDGSVPGEIYANALYYFAPQKGVAVDSMSGSGMLRRVYNDRARWQKDSEFNLDIHLFDKYPKDPFASDYDIKQHDAMRPLPLMADWVFMDPPYFGQSDHLYNGELAQTQDYTQYYALMKQAIIASYQSLNPDGVLCLLTNPYITWGGDFIDVPFDMSTIARNAGFVPVFSVVINRCEQWRPYGGHVNNKAKRLRQMYSDTSTLLVFKVSDNAV